MRRGGGVLRPATLEVYAQSGSALRGKGSNSKRARGGGRGSEVGVKPSPARSHGVRTTSSLPKLPETPDEPVDRSLLSRARRVVAGKEALKPTDASTASLPPARPTHGRHRPFGKKHVNMDAAADALRAGSSVREALQVARESARRSEEEEEGDMPLHVDPLESMDEDEKGVEDETRKGKEEEDFRADEIVRVREENEALRRELLRAVEAAEKRGLAKISSLEAMLLRSQANEAEIAAKLSKLQELARACVSAATPAEQEEALVALADKIGARSLSPMGTPRSLAFRAATPDVESNPVLIADLRAQVSAAEARWKETEADSAAALQRLEASFTEERRRLVEQRESAEHSLREAVKRETEMARSVAALRARETERAAALARARGQARAAQARVHGLERRVRALQRQDRVAGLQPPVEEEEDSPKGDDAPPHDRPMSSPSSVITDDAAVDRAMELRKELSPAADLSPTRSSSPKPRGGTSLFPTPTPTSALPTPSISASGAMSGAEGDATEGLEYGRRAKTPDATSTRRGSPFRRRPSLPTPALSASGGGGGGGDGRHGHGGGKQSNSRIAADTARITALMDAQKQLETEVHILRDQLSNEQERRNSVEQSLREMHAKERTLRSRLRAYEHAGGGTGASRSAETGEESRGGSGERVEVAEGSGRRGGGESSAYAPPGMRAMTPPSTSRLREAMDESARLLTQARSAAADARIWELRAEQEKARADALARTLRKERQKMKGGAHSRAETVDDTATEVDGGVGGGGGKRGKGGDSSSGWFSARTEGSSHGLATGRMTERELARDRAAGLHVSTSRTDITSRGGKRPAAISDAATERMAKQMQGQLNALRTRLRQAEQESASLRAARDRDAKRHADALVAARNSLTQSERRRENEIAALQTELAAASRSLVAAQRRILEAEEERDIARETAAKVDAAEHEAKKAREAESRAVQFARSAQHKVVSGFRMLEALRSAQQNFQRRQLQKWRSEAFVIRPRREVEAEEAIRRAKRAAEEAEKEEGLNSLAEAAARAFRAEKRLKELEPALEKITKERDEALQRRDEARLAVGQERRKMAAARDLLARVKAERESWKRVSTVTGMRHMISILTCVTSFRRAIRERDEETHRKMGSLEGRAKRIQLDLEERLRRAIGQANALRDLLIALPKRVEEAPGEARIVEARERQERAATALVRARRGLEAAAKALHAAKTTEGVRRGAARAYEHKLRELMNESAVLPDGRIDQRHANAARRLEMDIEVAADKAARATEQVHEATQAYDRAFSRLNNAIDSATAAKDAALVGIAQDMHLAIEAVREAAGAAESGTIEPYDTTSSSPSLSSSPPPPHSSPEDDKAPSIYHGAPDVKPTSPGDRGGVIWRSSNGSGIIGAHVDKVFEAASVDHDQLERDAMPQRERDIADGLRRNKWGETEWEPQRTEAYRRIVEKEGHVGSESGEGKGD